MSRGGTRGGLIAFFCCVFCDASSGYRILHLDAPHAQAGAEHGRETGGLSRVRAPFRRGVESARHSLRRSLPAHPKTFILPPLFLHTPTQSWRPSCAACWAWPTTRRPSRRPGTRVSRWPPIRRVPLFFRRASPFLLPPIPAPTRLRHTLSMWRSERAGGNGGVRARCRVASSAHAVRSRARSLLSLADLSPPASLTCRAPSRPPSHPLLPHTQTNSPKPSALNASARTSTKLSWRPPNLRKRRP